MTNARQQHQQQHQEADIHNNLQPSGQAYGMTNTPQRSWAPHEQTLTLPTGDWDLQTHLRLNNIRRFEAAEPPAIDFNTLLPGGADPAPSEPVIQSPGMADMPGGLNPSTNADTTLDTAENRINGSTINDGPPILALNIGSAGNKLIDTIDPSLLSQNNNATDSTPCCPAFHKLREQEEAPHRVTIVALSSDSIYISVNGQEQVQLECFEALGLDAFYDKVSSLPRLSLRFWIG